MTSASLPFFTTTSMRSCDSDSKISQGVMPACLVGTLSRSMSIPTLPPALISDVEQVMPAAPISCMPTMASISAKSMEASRSNFSWKGSPTCTEGMSFALSLLKSLEANAAPWMPSRPVEEPTINTGLPGPPAFAEICLPTSTMPAENAFTSGFCS